MANLPKFINHPAFPVEPFRGDPELGIPPMKGNSGMDMRRFFAALALPGVISISEIDAKKDDIIAEAFAYADKMLMYAYQNPLTS